MLRRWHKGSNLAANEKKARDAQNKAYQKARNKFFDVCDKVGLADRELLRESKRAKGKYELFERGLEAYNTVLQALEANETACKQADAVKDSEALIKAHEAHINHPNEHTIKALEEANQKMQAAQKAKEETTKGVTTAINKVWTEHDKAVEDMNANFGTGVVRSSSRKREDNELARFSEDARDTLRLRSIFYLKRAISYWKSASEVQMTICSAYNEEKISKLKVETDNLERDMNNQSLDIPMVENKTQRIKEIEEEYKGLLDKKAEETIKDANRELHKIFRDMDHLRREVKSAEEDRDRILEERKQERQGRQEKRTQTRRMTHGLALEGYVHQAQK